MSRKCKRPNCTRMTHRQGLCQQHYDHIPVRGYVDAGPTKERIELLLSRGYGWARLEAEGISWQWWSQIGDRVQALKEAQVLSIPVPARVVAGGIVPAVGTIRRMQALAAMGWPFTLLGPMIGHHKRYLAQLMWRDEVLSATAAKIDALYRELAMTPGPSKRIRQYSRNKGWVTAAAWDDIDNPDEKPDTGSRVSVPRADEIAELQEMGFTTIQELAWRLGIEPASVKRTMRRAAA